MTQASDSPVLDAIRAAFLVRAGLSIIVASRSADFIPSVGRGGACRVGNDRSHVSIIVPTPGADTLLADLKASGSIAVVFCEVVTHHTLQLKGEDAVVAPPGPTDVATFREALEARIPLFETMGYAEAFTRQLYPFDPRELVTVRFTPRSLFDQTPGPRAGLRL